MKWIGIRRRKRKKTWRKHFHIIYLVWSFFSFSFSVPHKRERTFFLSRPPYIHRYIDIHTDRQHHRSKHFRQTKYAININIIILENLITVVSLYEYKSVIAIEIPAAYPTHI